MALVEQELLTLPDNLKSPPVFSGVRFTRSLVFCVCFVDRCLFFWSLCCLLFFHIRIRYAMVSTQSRLLWLFCYRSAYDVTSFVFVVLLWRGVKKAYMTLDDIHYENWSIQTFLTLECLWPLHPLYMRFCYDADWKRPIWH